MPWQFGFDQITDLLVEKVHETVLEVNLNAVVANLNYYRSFMKPETKLVCMIKADAYGAGSVEIAKTLQDHRVDYLAVAVADEGATLRRNGITSNIMIMNPEMSAFKTMFDYDLEPEVYSFRLLDALVKAAEKEGITGWPVHIKLDTGMHRLGFDPEKDIDKLIDRLKHQDAIIPRSVFSHFVGSDSDDFDAFSAHQFELFDKGSRKLQAAFSHKILRHIDNSAGIEHFPERQLDMCRLGLGLYGINSRNNHVINNVSTLKTTILQLRNVPAGDTVGYSRKGTIDHDSVIAAIPIGYADGLNRHLGNRHCYCLVNGHKAEYVKAEKLLLGIRPYIKYFDSSDYIDDLADGSICLAVGWSGDILQAAERANESGSEIHVDYIVPKEGALIFYDMMTIPADADHPENAEKFMNYLLRPEVMASISSYVHYFNAVPASKPLVDKETSENPNIFLPDELLSKMFMVKPMPPKITKEINKIWTKIKSTRTKPE